MVSLPIACAAVLSLAAALCLGAVVLGVAHDGPALPYVGLFATSLVAGTTLPFMPASSEIAMAGLLAAGVGVPSLLVGAAITGSILGASANYLVGWNMARFAGCRWSPLTPAAMERTTRWFGRYGVWLILMCWVPMAGDAITVVAGLMRADLRLFLAFTAAGKAFGHIAVASGTNWLI